ncbi:MAG: GreA/GreB family elongation factor [Verrucomicrobiales bacterium]|nr:GreA/GreB family elongation factor [Verrucomicrobiales bacterium]
MNEQVQTLVDAGRLDSEIGEKISALEPGTFCLHKSWGPGTVKEWDLFGDRLVIDFEKKPGHSMKLQFAANSLDVLGSDHVMAKFAADPEGVKQLAADDPVDFAKQVLTSFGGSMFLDNWEDEIKGRIVAEEKYRSWWESAKRQIRSDNRFLLPSKRNIPFELRDENLSAGEALIGDFEAAKDIKAKIKVLENLRKNLDTFDEPAIELEDVVNMASSTAAVAIKKTPGVAVELLLARDGLVEDIDGMEAGRMPVLDVLREHSGRFPEILKGMGVACQRQVYLLSREVFGEDEWVSRLIAALEGSGTRAIAEISKFIHENGKGDTLTRDLTAGLQQRSLGAEVLAWICKERKGFAAGVFSDPGISAAIIAALERDHLDESTPKTNRLHDLLMDDKELVPDLLAESDTAEVRHFTRRIQSTPVFEGLNKNSLLARIIKVFPSVEDLITGEKSEGVEETLQPAGVIVSWESLQQRREKLDDIINKKIPENSKEIGIAREYGDLKENFEFKAAKQQQAVLMRQKAELEAEIATARGTDFSEADGSAVAVGTIVEIEDVNSGGSETVTVLGAWDTDIEKSIVSYLSAMGAALLGRVAGDELELPTEKDGESRKVRIASIKPYAG